MKKFTSEASRRIRRDVDLLKAQSTDETYIRLTRELDKVVVDDVEYYLVEGDILLDEDELFFYAQKRAVANHRLQVQSTGMHHELGDAPGSVGSTELTAIERDGKPVRWEPGRTLTYCVLKRTFESEDNYHSVVDFMMEAAASWEQICGVSFGYLPNFDDSADLSPDGVLFPVREISVESKMLASAFFPIDASFRRRLLINRLKYYDTAFSKVGVLRHELGHILGFRHEHIRSGAPAACPGESEAQTIPLTAYDPNSVMHYYCGGKGDPELKFTQFDIDGARSLYGPPLAEFEVATFGRMEILEKEDGDKISFEIDIKNLFRDKDRSSMLAFGPFDLWKYEDVRDNADDILSEVKQGTMPCDEKWSSEKVEKFEKWIADGMNP